MESDKHLLIFAILTILLGFAVSMITRYALSELRATEENPISEATTVWPMALVPLIYLIVLLAPLPSKRTWVKRFILCTLVALLAGDFGHDVVEILAVNDALAWAFAFTISSLVLLAYYRPWKRPISLDSQKQYSNETRGAAAFPL